MLDNNCFESIIRDLGKRRILVIGDIIRDRYIIGPVERISPEAPVPVLRIEKKLFSLGGAANAAENLIPFGVNVFMCGVVGEDEQGFAVLDELKSKGIDTSGIIKSPERPTSVKTRIIANNQQLLRLDEEDLSPLSDEDESFIISAVGKLVHDVDGVIISDYGKGVVSARLVAETVKLASDAGVKVTVDPKGLDYSKYRGVSALTPNRNEAETASGMPGAPLDRIAGEIKKKTGYEYLLITLGPEGMYLDQSLQPAAQIKSRAREVYDVTGAGDTVIALFSAALFSGYSAAESAEFANIAAGIVVGKKGSAVTNPMEMTGWFSPYSFLSGQKIKNRQEIDEICTSLRNNGKKIVFTNGCFDLLHFGHIRYLSKAKEKGDILVVGINSDESVKRLKGENRPLLSEKERGGILSALECIDFVTVFEEDTPLEIISGIVPDVLAKGGDYKAEDVVGKDFVENHGGKVEIIPFVEGFSTTGLINEIKRKF